MKPSKSGLLVVLTIIALNASAQRGFHFQSKLGTVDAEGWRSLSLPDTIYRYIQRDFSDFRIYQFQGKDTLESPYLLKILTAHDTDLEAILPMINKSTGGGKQYYTFELTKNQHVNHLDLEFEEANFNGYVQLEGSADQKQWFSVDSLRRIVSVHQGDIDFKSTAIDFSEVSFAFLRLSINADKPLNLTKASFKNRSVEPGTYIKAPIQYTSENVKASHQTILNIKFKSLSFISRLCIKTSHTADFYRPILIVAVTDSTKAPKGWIYQTDGVYSGTITSLNDNCFEFPAQMVRNLRVIISNADNNSLSINSIEAFGPSIELRARLLSGENYLFYGNPQIGPPSYDVVHFEQTIPASLAPVSIGPSRNIAHAEEQHTPFITSKIWLWLAMGVVIAVLGYFTLSMMKAKS